MVAAVRGELERAGRGTSFSRARLQGPLAVQGGKEGKEGGRKGEGDGLGVRGGTLLGQEWYNSLSFGPAALGTGLGWMA